MNKCIENRFMDFCRPASPRRHRDCQSGIALLIVLWVLVLLSVIAGEFSYTMSNQVRMVSNFKESAQAYYMAVGGVNQTIYHILQTETQRQASPGSDKSRQNNSLTAGQWPTNGTIGPLDLGDQGYLKLRIENEGGKINLNQADANLLHTLMDAFDIDDDQKNIIVDSILDWRDENDLHRANGAEKDYYRSLPDPYDCRNGDFQSKSELLLVRGVTRQLYYGGLEDLVTVLPEQKQEASGLGGLLRSLGNAGKSGGAGGKLNINAVPLRLLQAFADIKPETAEGVEAYRQAQDIGSISELGTVVEGGQFEIIRRHFTADPLPYYRIWAMGYTRNHISETVEVLVRINPGQDQDKPYEILEWNDSIT